MENKAPTTTTLDKSPQVPEINRGLYHPISKRQLFLKLVPFFIVSVLILALIIALIVEACLHHDNALSFIISLLVCLIVIMPFDLILFFRPFCKFNRRCNDWFKRWLGKWFVASTSKNGCFPLRQWYLNNDSLTAFELEGETIIKRYAELNPEEYDNTIKYYKDHSIC